MQEELGHYKNSLKKFEGQITSKANIVDVDRVVLKFADYATTRAFEELSVKVLPPLKQFQELILKFRHENLQQKEVNSSYLNFSHDR